MARLTLSFSRVACGRCGAPRQTRFPCPDCGKAAAPTEIDVNVQARQRAVHDAAAARSAEPNQIEDNALEILGAHGLGQLPDRAFAAADRLASGDARGPEEFAALAGEVASLERWADDAVSLRPLITLTRHAQTVIRALVQVYDVLARALAEERLDEAQRASDAIQESLDAAALEATKAHLLLERAGRVLDAADPMGAWIAEAFEGDPVDATRRGQVLLEQHTGRVCGPEPGLAALFLDIVVSTIGDPDEFWHLVREHIQLLAEARTEIPALVSDPLFSSRLVDITHDLWDAARRAAVAPESETLRSTAGELLEAGHLLMEQPLKFHLGVICGATTRKTFADTQAGDVSELLGIARDKSWAIASALGDAHLRNAFAHRDFQVVADGVSLSPQRRRRAGDPERVVRLDQVQDQVLRLVETTAAMDLALTVVMNDLDVGVRPPALGRLFVGPLLAGFGWTEVEVANDGVLVTISAVAHEAVPLRAMAFAAQPLVGSAERLRLRLTRSDTGAHHEVEVDLDTFSAWADTDDDLEKEAAFVRMCRATQRDGQPLFSDAHVEKFAAFRGCQILVDKSLPEAEMARRVNIWRKVARDLGLDEVSRELGKGVRLRLQAGTGLPADPGELDDLIALAGRTMPGLPDSLA